MKTAPKRLRILNLARWYPNRYDPMPGLFIERHAEAVALYADVAVVYTHAVGAGSLHRNFEIDFEEKNGLNVAKVYYNNLGSKIPLLNHGLKLFRFLKANYLGIKKVSEKDKKFDLIHVHVLTRLGAIALYYKWIHHGIPFVITEHWTRYLNHTNGFDGFIRKMLTKIVVKQAAVVTSVSQDLSLAMQQHGLSNPDYRVIPNVVAPVFFEVPLKDTKGESKEFVHVSCFTDKHKNISGLLRVIKALAEQRNDFHFTLVGDGEDFEKMKAFAKGLKIPEKQLQFTGLLEGKVLANTMAAADALVIFSNYENMPVVINESFVMAVPVFSTKVGGIAEMVNNSNGRLVEKGDEPALLAVLTDFLDGKITFNNQEIRAQALVKFSANTIGEIILEIYQGVLKSA